MSPADVPSRADGDEPAKHPRPASMRTSVRLLAGTAAAASLLPALTRSW